MQKLSLRYGFCPEDRASGSDFVMDYVLSNHSCDAGRGEQVPGERPSSG